MLLSAICIDLYKQNFPVSSMWWFVYNNMPRIFKILSQESKKNVDIETFNTYWQACFNFCMGISEWGDKVTVGKRKLIVWVAESIQACLAKSFCTVM